MKGQILLACFLFFAAGALKASGAPEERPRIEQVQPQEHDLGEWWQQVKTSQVSFVIQLLHTYPDRDLYFLARDAELFYDTAVLMSGIYPQLRSRIHLLNVSRSSVHSPHLLSYLQQEGISEEALQRGKKVLFVDTGFTGSIPKAIKKLFPEAAEDQLQTHLVGSNDPRIPSSRVFVQSFDQHELITLAGELEVLVRHANSAAGYEWREGRWRALTAETSRGMDWPADPAEALKYQQDLAYSFQNGEYTEKIRREDALWRELMAIYYSGRTREQKIERLKEFRQVEDGQEFLRDAMLRDMAEVTLLTRKTPEYISSTDLGLPVLASQPISLAQVIDIYPSFSEVLFDPFTAVPRLFAEGDYTLIEDILYTLEDPEVLTRTRSEMLARSREPGVQQLIRKALAGESGLAEELIQSLLPKQGLHNVQVYIRQVLSRQDRDLSYLIIQHVLSQPHIPELGSHVDQVLDSGDQGLFLALAKFVFSKEHSRGLGDQLYRLVLGASESTLEYLEVAVFSTPHAVSMRRAYRAFLQKQASGSKGFLPEYLEPSERLTCSDLLAS